MRQSESVAMNEYKPGDVVNGHVLTSDNQWVPLATWSTGPPIAPPVTPPSTPPRSRGGLLMAALALGAFMVFGLVVALVASGLGSSPQAATAGKATASSSSAKPTSVGCATGYTWNGKVCAIVPVKESPRPAAESATTSWIPKGYWICAEDIACNWGKSGADGFLGYVTLLVVSRDGLSHGYIEANVLDKHGAVVGMTNGVIGRLTPGQVAKVKLYVTEDDGATIDITKVDAF